MVRIPAVTPDVGRLTFRSSWLLSTKYKYIKKQKSQNETWKTTPYEFSYLFSSLPSLRFFLDYIDWKTLVIIIEHDGLQSLLN